jgi:hypothetical protein
VTHTLTRLFKKRDGFFVELIAGSKKQSKTIGGKEND